MRFDAHREEVKSFWFYSSIKYNFAILYRKQVLRKFADNNFASPQCSFKYAETGITQVSSILAKHGLGCKRGIKKMR